MASSAYQAELEAICPEGWKVVPLTDAVIFQEGPGILAKDFQSSGVPLIRLKGVEGDFVSLEGCNFLAPEKVASKWNHFRLERGDLVISTSASFGRVSEVTEESAGAVPYTGLIRFQPKTKEIDAGFLRAFLGSSAFMQQVEAMASGSVIRHFGPMHLKQMALPLPPLGEQRAIGNMAKLFAERLRNQSQTNESLEAMARALFKAWFVDFEPVRAKMEGRWRRGESLPGLPANLYDLFPDRLVESELGEIPEGWEIQSVQDIGEIICGKTPSTKVSEYYGDDIPFITIPEMHGNIFAIDVKRRLSHEGANSQRNKMLPQGAVCVSCIATLGLVVITTEPSQTNQQINSVVPSEKGTTYYWYWVLKNLGDEIKAGGSGGSVLGNLSTGRFAELKVTASTQKLRLAYHAMVEALFSEIMESTRESRNLSQLRDTLLPKLISGELRVPDADRIVGA